ADMKKILIISSILLLFVLIVLFGNFIFMSNKTISSQHKIGFVISGIDDKGFADMQIEGVKNASRLYKINYKLYITGSFDNIKEGILNAIKDGNDIVICGNGFLAEKPILEVAPLYPKVYFICMDTIFSYYPQNVCSVSFKQNEGSFLAGVLAAKMTRLKTIGFIGGMDIPVINDFLIGFIQGIKYIDEKINIVYRFVDKMSKKDPFQDEQEGYNIAKNILEKYNADIIYAVSGKTNMGIFEALKIEIENQTKNKDVKENKIFAIGVDTDQDYLIPGYILTSMIKNLDTGVVYIIDKIINKEFSNKNYRIGLKENGVGLSEMKYTKEIIGKEIINLLEQLKNKIISKEIVVKSVYD
ncbi:MAG: BMP family ABC transporter substrate-binding protein, partial [Spirochaetota bacterium]